jgi:hypothetical protein
MSTGDRIQSIALRVSRLRGAALPIGGSLALLALVGCGGGGGGSSGSGFDSHGKLLAVEFPDPSDVNTEPVDTPPAQAPLLQQVVFTFDSNPDPNSIGNSSIQILDENGFPVPGRFVVEGPVVTFTPVMPTRPVTIGLDGSVDDGGAGLSPGGAFTIRLGTQTLHFISQISSTLLARFRDPNNASGILIGFRTGTDPTHFFAGLPLVPPTFLESDPVDGVTGVSPDLYTDPGNVFPPRRTFLLRFDAPVSPDLANVSGDTFHLVDLDDRPGGFPNGLPLGINVSVLENELDHSVIEISPSGILPFGHQLALEYPVDLQGVSQTGTLGGTTAIATTFTTATTSAGLVDDTLSENFDSNDRQETDPAQTGNVLPANWNLRGSGLLQANFAFQGDGMLGRFAPPPPASGDTKVIVLDTTQQPFPLFDGSTPDAPVFTIVGGVFPFTDIDIPNGVVIQPLGNNPLVLTATGSVRIAGQIQIGGQNGNGDYAYDSAVTSVPGGAAVAGGGRGGEGHPILFYPPDQVSYSNLVSPTYGGQGFGIDPVDGVMKRIGGGGGQCGMIDNPNSNGKYSTDHELDCNEFRSSNPGVKVPGGGGGSMYLQGHRPGNSDGGYSGNLRNGRGNVLPDGQGHYTIRDIDDKVLACGQIGSWPFYNDGTGQNDFFGSRGQLKRLVGGQGGGSGASSVEGYYCGIWCDHDQDKSNDGVCNGEDFGPSGKYGDSVGDARGGGGGGGGGAVLIQALGAIVLNATGRIDAHGGDGLGGEAIACSNFGGGGAGGAGGMVIIQSATDIRLDAGTIINVQEGGGDSASSGDVYTSCDNSGSAGDGGHGGQGFVQLQVPAGQVPTVIDAATAFPRRNTKYDPLPWIDQSNTLNPVEFTPISVAVSTWFDLGRMIARQPGTTPTFTFGGLDANGVVLTDVDGHVLDPAGTDIECDYLGEYDEVHHVYKAGKEPQADFIPPNATVKVEFQGANAIVEGSKEIDPASTTLWGTSSSVANGFQFIRWRVTFDLTANTTDPLSPDTPRPTVQKVQVHSQF